MMLSFGPGNASSTPSRALDVRVGISDVGNDDQMAKATIPNRVCYKAVCGTAWHGAAEVAHPAGVRPDRLPTIGADRNYCERTLVQVRAERIDPQQHRLSPALVSTFRNGDFVMLSVSYGVHTEILLKLPRESWEKLVRSVAVKERALPPTIAPHHDDPTGKYTDLQLPNFDDVRELSDSPMLR
jgi:hypothetical protein